MHIEMPPVLIGLVVWRKPQEGGISCSQEPPLCHRVLERGAKRHRDHRWFLTKEKINKGEVVIIWGGNFVSKETAHKEKDKGKALQQIDEDVCEVFDYETRNEDASYNHNHSCDPNTCMKDEVTIIARRDIASNEELTIDYAMFMLDENYQMPTECKCGTKKCRKTITGKDWRLAEIQNRYKNEFSPAVKKRIELKK